MTLVPCWHVLLASQSSSAPPPSGIFIWAPYVKLRKQSHHFRWQKSAVYAHCIPNPNRDAAGEAPWRLYTHEQSDELHQLLRCNLLPRTFLLQVTCLLKNVHPLPFHPSIPKAHCCCKTSCRTLEHPVEISPLAHLLKSGISHHT